MRKKTVKLTMIDGKEWYVPEEEFNTFNVPESPESIISNYIRGSKGPLLRVNEMEDMSGAYTRINATYIVQVDIAYKD